jgi:hypothetical protein
MRTGYPGKSSRARDVLEPLWDRGARLFGILWKVAYAGDSGVTKPALAQIFHVSSRTIDRDVAALVQATVPLIISTGGGGYIKIKLLPEARPVAEKLINVYESRRAAWRAKHGLCEEVTGQSLDNGQEAR